MKYHHAVRFSCLVIAMGYLTLAAIRTPANAAEIVSGSATNLAEKILDATNVQGGIVVHLGCGDGRLTAALHSDDRYTIHGLDADPDNVAQARKYIQSHNVYGPVSVEHFAGSSLPYADSLVNLVVVQEAGDVSMDEIMRVLVPLGVGYAQAGDKWQKIVKPWPDNIDQWSHFLHDASNNAVANDTQVGPPRSLQWIAPPLWLRSHETPAGVQSPVSANGRLFYFFDEGLIGITDERLPDRWSLVCRDAFNGKLLWKRSLDSWGWKAWNPDVYQGKDWTKLRGKRTDVPVENQRKIVAAEDRVYVTLAYGAPMSILDAATGDMVAVVENTKHAREILFSDGVSLVYTQETPQALAQRRGIEDKVTAALIASDGHTGKVLWEIPCGTIRPLTLAINNGRILHTSGKDLLAHDLRSGNELWKTRMSQAAPRTVVAIDDVLILKGAAYVAVYDAVSGQSIWQKQVTPIKGAEADDLFVVDGVVWRGIISVDDEGTPVSKTPNALVVGWDLRSGKERKRILVNNLRSPEHHHRCYRNKATSRYLISSHEGAEFLDFQEDNHGQNNWIRGVCKNGMMPCNGMLYVPPDQCFCQPGAKLLGYTALTTGPDSTTERVPEGVRLYKGSAYNHLRNPQSASRNPEDWPTFRHDARRSGSTASRVNANVAVQWKAELGGKLTAPVAAEGKLFVAQPDAHTIYALDAINGNVQWQFTASGRVDSPPTIHNGLVFFGSKDGHVYCLRVEDGELAWRFQAAPYDRRIAHYGQVESSWPVHGSVLVENDVAYFTAGRSTYLDGGIRVFGLDPASGRKLYEGLLEGPHHDTAEGERDLGFFILGANSDVLVSESGFIYMRQKKMTPQLEEVKVDVLSSKGAQDVGLHVFSTSGFLDDSWYNRTFWMYSRRWPGFQLANQAPKTGQLLVVDDEKTFAVRVFYRRNVHSPMFFPGKEGYLLFADWNSSEPQIVGEEGSRNPIAWLPQSDYPRGRNDEVRTLESEAFALDKMMGYTRADPPLWMSWLPVRIRAMVKAADTLFVAGAPDVIDPKDPYAAFEDRKGAQLVAVSADDGAKLSELMLESPPVFDGLIAAGGKLFTSLRDGSVVCLAAE